MAFNLEQQKIFYNEIVKLYELADEMLKVIETSKSKNVDAEFALAEPLIKQIGISTDIITEQYIKYLESGKKEKSAARELETAIRKVFIEIEQFVKKVQLKYC